jgi:cytochrome c553
MIKLRRLKIHAALLAAALLSGPGALAEGGEGIEEKVKLCATCHGEQGTPIDRQTPVIWGQNEGYLFLQLRDYKTESRKHPVMGQIAATLERPDMLALAAHFSKLKWPSLQQPSPSGDVTAKAQSAAIAGTCTACHFDQYQGDSSNPRLAGQWQDYLHRTMTEFRDGTRGNNPGMSQIMRAISPEDIAALAQYLAGLQIQGR